MSDITIRKAQPGDLPRILTIYARARAFMVEQGNPRQWAANNWPPQDLLEQDIALGRLYVMEVPDSKEGHKTIEGVFLYLHGVDIEPTYRTIDGAFTQTDPNADYGVIHRIASSGTVKGLARTAVAWALDQCPYLRMDTHPDNKPMQNMFKSLGFRYCGIIHVVEDNDPRLAFDITKSDYKRAQEARRS